MDMKLQLPNYVNLAIKELTDSGYSCYVVGGAVRDALLERELSDYDLATDALPAQLHAIFHAYPTIDTGIKHGTLTVIIEDNPIEITTYRTDGTYMDHRHPSQVTFTPSLQEDCARRDFTINALAYHPRTGIIDFFHGMDDLNNHIIRTVNDPDQRFQEDALRILRALRFSAQLGFDLDEDTKSALFRKKEDLFYVSSERILKEFELLLTAKACTQVLLEYRPVLEVVLPEIKNISLSAWQTTLTAIERSKKDLIIRMAILFTPIKDLFYQSIYRRLHMSSNNTDGIRSLLKYQDLPLDTTIHIRKVLQKIAVPFPTYLEYRIALDPSLPKDDIVSTYNAILENHDCITLGQLAINGNDLKELGLQGEAIGIGLHKCLDAVIEEKCPNDKEALLQYVKTF